MSAATPAKIAALQEAIEPVRRFEFGGVGGFYPHDLENITKDEADEILEKIMDDLNREGSAVMRTQQSKTLDIQGFHVTIQPVRDEYGRKTFLAKIEL